MLTPSTSHCWSGVGAVVQFSCSDNCGCGGDCHANGTASMEGASFAVTGGVCSCSLPDDPHSDPTPSMPDPLVGGLSISFSKSAVIFEDEYRDTEDGSPVSRRSTTTLLTVSASGGTFGGAFELTTRNLGKLIAANGPGPVSLITEKILAPYETYFASFVCEGVTASGSANDVEVSGSFIEFDTGRTESSSDAVTVVQLVVMPSILFPQPLVNRHVFGVCESMVCQFFPRGLSRVSWHVPENVLKGASRYNVQYFQYLLEPGNVTLMFSYNSISYPVQTQCIVPTGIVRKTSPSLVIYNVPIGHAGGVGMDLNLALCPTNVSFSGIRLMEQVTGDGVPTGYFSHSYFSNWWNHTGVQGAGEVINVGLENDFSDEVRMEDSCPPLSEAGYWSAGDITWTIPTVWREPSDFSVSRGYQNLSTEQQVFTIDTVGTVGVEKFKCRVERPVGGMASWSDIP